MKRALSAPDETRLSTFALPFYPEIKLEFFAHRRLAKVFREFEPDFVHIATEGPLGWAARRLCLHRTLPFTTAYHTRFPEYLAARAPRVLSSFVRTTAYAVLRRFHAPASAVMVATASIEEELRSRKFRRLVRWSRGVDANLFRPYGKDLPVYSALPRPILLYVGRVAVEKNLRAFLDIDTVGSQVVIGDGPDLAFLRQEYPGVHFLGAMSGEELGAPLRSRRSLRISLDDRHFRPGVAGSLCGGTTHRGHACVRAVGYIRGRRRQISSQSTEIWAAPSPQPYGYRTIPMDPATSPANSLGDLHTGVFCSFESAKPKALRLLTGGACGS